MKRTKLLIGCLIICSCIGLITFLLGCNQSSDFCPNYNPYQGYVYKRYITEHTCSKCSRRDSKNKCVTYYFYQCYNAYVYATQKININNQTSNICYIQTDTNDNSLSNAQESISSYEIGKKINWMQIKNTDECKLINDVIILWYVGVVFLSLSGLILLIIIKLVITEESNLIYPINDNIIQRINNNDTIIHEINNNNTIHVINNSKEQDYIQNSNVMNNNDTIIVYNESIIHKINNLNEQKFIQDYI